MKIAPTLRREELSVAFRGNKRLVRAFEAQAQAVDDTSEVVNTTIQATGALQDATVLTLSPNDTFRNERVLGLGSGLEGEDNDGVFTIRLASNPPIVSGGFSLNIVVSGDATVRVPLTGQLATTENAETLKSKTLDAPSFANLGDYADDTAAAAGGVVLGQAYRTGSTLKVRVI